MDVFFCEALHRVGEVVVAFLGEHDGRQRIAFLEECYSLAELVGAAVAVCVDAEELCTLGRCLVQIKADRTVDIVLRLGEGDLAKSIHDRNGKGLGFDARNGNDVVVELDGSLDGLHDLQAHFVVDEAEFAVCGRGRFNICVVEGTDFYAFKRLSCFCGHGAVDAPSERQRAECCYCSCECHGFEHGHSDSFL